MTVLAEDHNELWENDFVKVSHIILRGEGIVHEPFMLTELDPENRRVSCQCFYASVVFTEKFIIVFSNEAGGMCPIDLDYLHKAFKLPEELIFNDAFNKLLEKIKD